MTVRKDKSTRENREFWEAVAQAAKTVESWPAWKRGEPKSTFVIEPGKLYTPKSTQTLHIVTEQVGKVTLLERVTVGQGMPMLALTSPLARHYEQNFGRNRDLAAFSCKFLVGDKIMEFCLHGCASDSEFYRRASAVFAPLENPHNV